MTERILSILVEDKPGVLARVSSTISRRGFNIKSLSVGPTSVEGRSKMTIVTDANAVEQVKKQLNKLINVIKIIEFDPKATIEVEVMIIKISTTKETQTPVIEKATLSNARSVDVGVNSVIFQITGTSIELNKFEELMKPYGIIDMVRGGRVAMQGIQS